MKGRLTIQVKSSYMSSSAFLRLTAEGGPQHCLSFVEGSVFLTSRVKLLASECPWWHLSKRDSAGNKKTTTPQLAYNF
jgi:hypothetical protein